VVVVPDQLNLLFLAVLEALEEVVAQQVFLKAYQVKEMLVGLAMVQLMLEAVVVLEQLV
jgi:hypothetical protein